ncbi:OmpA family protein [Acidovorax sp. CCYZU-2555]|uniref:OmpA family protein n=1 Tax=Acidovorax sp. CCYZU-2555 TaxID=2835042 RepID=UPI001BCEDC66|nr:OmpA family protein [Acidovorax sp. CCYZU-2555]MBS7778663.1 OmpA family protein [Acidovorax sp. CCYZU-2555]
MSSNSDDDSQQRFALGLVFALIALIVSTVVGTVVYQRVLKAPTAATGAVVPAVLIVEEALVRVENGVVKFYFATGKADVAIGGNVALADVVRGVANGKRARISGFHDATGDAAVNAELAKQRALAVQATLLTLGVDQNMVELSKPEQTLAGGSNAEARRVEVILID